MSFPGDTYIYSKGYDDTVEILIKDIEIGTEVTGFDGKPNRVTGIEKQKLGPRKLWKINDEIIITGMQLMWSNRGWACIEPDRYIHQVINETYPLITNQGVEQIIYHGIQQRHIVPLMVDKRNLLLGYEESSGWVDVENIEEVLGRDHEEFFYALMVDGSHTIRANGYWTSGCARDDDYVYPRVGKPGKLHKPKREKIK